MMTEKAVRKMLADQCDAAGGQQAWAKRYGLSESYVCDAIRGRRALGRKLIDALRLRYVAMYVSDEVDVVAPLERGQPIPPVR